MSPIRSLKRWWQLRTRRAETPFDGDAPSWFVSMVFHLALILGISLISLDRTTPEAVMELLAPPETVEELEEVPEEFHFSNQEQEEIGAKSELGDQMALSQAAVFDTISEIPKPTDLPDRELGQIELNETVKISTGLTVDRVPVKGHAGTGVSGAEGAVDRLTHEILMSLNERKTLVVWLFDQSGSLTRQREQILSRFDRIYEELHAIEKHGNEAFDKHEGEAPLLSSVVAFGSEVNLLTESPTADISELKKAVAGIKLDDSGIERVFTSVFMAAKEYEDLRRIDRKQQEPERNVLLVVVSDEAGDDQDGLEPTLQLCRKLEMPVYVIGVPAPFGRAETLVKWVDPDPSFDQTPQWGRVSQGPESLMPERIKLEFSGSGDQEQPIDSGFGPYALTRLCYETGGIYFTVHPNRRLNRNVSRREIDPFSAYIRNFFDPTVMRRYRPDYVSIEEYWRQVGENDARRALIQAAQESWVAQLDPPRVRFEKLDEARFVNEVTQAQRAAALLGPKVNRIFTILQAGESDRIKETVPRWQAGYDLAMGRVLAVKARTEGYNAILASAKRGLRFESEKNNTWVLKPSKEVTGGSRLTQTADLATEYLQKVIDEHQGTPWAELAQRELETPMGWKWTEDYTAPPKPRPRRRAGNNNNTPPAAARDDRAREIERPKTKRPPPKL